MAKRNLYIVREHADCNVTSANIVCQWNFWDLADAERFAAENTHRILTLTVV